MYVYFLDILGLRTGICHVFLVFWGEKGSDSGSKTLECIELMRENGNKSSQAGSAIGLVVV